MAASASLGPASLGLPAAAFASLGVPAAAVSSVSGSAEQRVFVINALGKEAPHPTEPNRSTDTINRVDYGYVNSRVGEQGECTVRGRLYNDPSSPGPYVLSSICGDVWEVPRSDGSTMLLYPGSREIWRRTFMHVPPGHYVDFGIKYLPTKARVKLAEIPQDAGDWTDFDVVGEGEVASAPGLFADLESSNAE